MATLLQRTSYTLLGIDRVWTFVPRSVALWWRVHREKNVHILFRTPIYFFTLQHLNTYFALSHGTKNC